MQDQSILTQFKKLFRGENHYIHEIWFFVVLSVSLYYFVSLFSFNPIDASSFSFKLPAEPIQNYGGLFGAKIAGLSFYYFGIVSFLLPLPFCLAIAGFKIFDKKNFALNTLGWIFLLGSIAWFANAISTEFSINNYSLPTSGNIGYHIFSFSSYTIGSIGAFIISCATFLVGLDLITKTSIFIPIQRYFQFVWLKIRPKISLSFISLDKLKHLFNFSKHKTSLSTSFSQNSGIEFNIPSSEPTIDGKLAFNQLVSPPLIIKTPVDIKPAQPTEISSRTLDKDPNFVIKQKDDGSEMDEETVEENIDEVPTYVPPKLEILSTTHVQTNGSFEIQELQLTADLLIQTFEEFNLKGEIIAVQPGPVVTVFEFRPSAGIKLNKVLGLMDDLALALKVDSIFINPVPGKRALGIQVPNKNRKMVLLGDIVSSSAFQDNPAPLTFGMGKAIDGTPFCCDLTKMPHLLVAGATGSGKSVAINSLLCSILMKSGPDDVRLLLVDPKMLELSIYEGIPHLLMPVITEPAKAGAMLRWAVQEMEKRYRIMQKAQVRNIDGFNAFWKKSSRSKRAEINDFIQEEFGDELTGNGLPLILIIIDELADLMLTAPKEIESLIQRLAQKARASGIHLVLATQRPSVDVITGVIKANLPSRVAFQVVSKHDSRTILDQVGAEKLLGKGDMLMQIPGKQRLNRIQGAFVNDDEVINLVEDLKNRWSSTYDNKVMDWVEENANQSEDNKSGASGSGECDDVKFDLAVEIAANHGSISASYLQRKLKIGYNRAARIVEAMEEQGMIGPASGSKPRKWLGPVHEII